MLPVDILIISPSLSMGGIQKASVNLANELVHLNKKVVYLTLFKQEHFFQLDNKIELIEPMSQLNSDSLSLFKSISWIRKEIQRVKPKVVFIYNKLYAAIGAISTIGLDVTLVISERSSPFYGWEWKTNLISKIFFSIHPPHKVISQTRIAGELHQKYYSNSKVAVIPNALREVGLHSDIKREKIILAVGRFNDPCKGFDLLIQTFNLIENEDWRLVFAGGTASEGQYLLEMAKGSKKSRIDFLGPVKEIDKEYARAGIFVMPSRSEGFPNALCEAMAAGCPVISFDFIAGPRDIINNEVDGIIVPPENVNILAKKIDELILDEKKRGELSQNALRIRERYAAPKLAQQFIDFILS